MTLILRTNKIATKTANTSRMYATALTVRLRKRMNAQDYATLYRAQTLLADLWNDAIKNPKVINGTRAVGPVYTAACKGNTQGTSGTIRRKLAEDIAAAFKSYDVVSKRNPKAQPPGPCTQHWRRARWDMYGATVRLNNDSIQLNLGKNSWITIDLSGDARWQTIKDRTLQLAADRDANDEITLRVICSVENSTPANPTQQRVRKHAPATAALDPGVRAWTLVVSDAVSGSRAHVIPAHALSRLRARKHTAKNDRRIVDAERKLARSIYDLLMDEGVVSLIVGITPHNGWARTNVLKRLYSLCNLNVINITLVNETNTSRTCPKCDVQQIQTTKAYGSWCCNACGFKRKHSAGRDVVAATLLLRKHDQSAIVPTFSRTFVHSAPFSTPVVPSASQQPRGSAPEHQIGTQKPGKDTHSKSPSGSCCSRQRRHSSRYHGLGFHVECNTNHKGLSRYGSLIGFTRLKLHNGKMWHRTL